MHPGELIADRFEVAGFARSGGMGDVYRARDRLTGEQVAVKVLQGNRALDGARFTREAEALADLRHPGIVRYVAHGATGSGELYLAMEWLEGEDLADRLDRGPLSIEEVVELARGVAEALAVAHMRGVIHRDIKPGNLYLPGGSIARCKILDFGIARLGRDARTATATGMMIGTPGYMAPEQARGDPDLDARTDVFALGCVLFECLTGKPAFVGEHVMALLAKILLDETPRVRSLVSGVPRELDDLVLRMMAKEPDERPRDGAAMMAEIAELESMEGTFHGVSSLPPEAITRREQRLLSVVMIGGEDLFWSSSATAPTMTSSDALDALTPLRAAVEAHGGRLEVLPGGAMVATLSGTGIATDQAAQAALCALAVRAAIPERPMALATGRGEVAGRLPVGEAIDRAARMLYARWATHPLEAAPLATARAEPIALDEVTAGLLGARFEVGGDAIGLELRGERAVHEVSRTVLGKPTSCVGRDRELAVLDGVFSECLEEGVARVVLVTGAPGIGKSRLRDEFVRAPRHHAKAQIWIARGDPSRAGSAFGLLAEALHNAAGIHAGEPLGTRQKKLRARVARHVSALDVGRVAEFLGEIAGTPFPEEGSVQLRAARRDAMLMGDQMRRAWEDFLFAECAAQPVVLVLEDLHWGDLPTIKLVDAALRRLAEQPLLVVALARPSVHQIFPGLWAERGLQEIRLGALTRRWSERLVRQILGDDADEATVARLLERAEGNAFYLEELVRAAASGKGAELPETVLAMAQARLEGLETEARRLLRAGSVFGQTFWSGGVAALLGGSSQDTNAPAWLATLEAREVITRSGESRFPGEDEYAFRHALFRDASYAMLTESDCVLGHRLAGRWLERLGECDAMMLAEHLERGGLPESAAGWYRRAAEEALEGNDLEAVVSRAERGLACIAAAIEADPEARQTIEMRAHERPSLSRPPASLSAPSAAATTIDPLERGALYLLLAEAHRWRGKLADAERSSLEAIAALPEGSRLWYQAVNEAVLASGRLGNADRVASVIELIRQDQDDASNAEAKVMALARAVAELLNAGRYDLADVLLADLDSIIARFSIADPAVLARMQGARARRALVLGDLGAFLQLNVEARAGFERAGHLRVACNLSVSIGYAHLLLGAYVEAEVTLREALIESDRLGLTGVSPSAKENLGMALAGQGRWVEARAVAVEAVEAFRGQEHRRMEAGALIYLALMLGTSGDLEAAEREARAALAVDPPPPLRAHALATLAEVLLARGAVEGALTAAREAIELLHALGTIEEGEALVRLVYAEALHASGDGRAASAILAARAHLLERAAKIRDPILRRSFLERVPENARTVARSREWTVEETFTERASLA
jgi:eukaryotic-like serine/threonine-protein kinase